MFFMLFILTSAFGNGGFGVGSDLSTIFYNMVFSSFIALAMSYNLTSGRLDFSIGSILILSLIAGASLAKQWQAGPLELVLIVLFIGDSLRIVLRLSLYNAPAPGNGDLPGCNYDF
jgi:ribose transport system permease protein